MSQKAGNVEQSQRKIIPGDSEHFLVHLHVHDISVNGGYMLIDLSDTVNWPHVETGRIILKKVKNLK